MEGRQGRKKYISKREGKPTPPTASLKILDHGRTYARRCEKGGILMIMGQKTYDQQESDSPQTPFLEGLGWNAGGGGRAENRVVGEEKRKKHREDRRENGNSQMMRKR